MPGRESLDFLLNVAPESVSHNPGCGQSNRPWSSSWKEYFAAPVSAGADDYPVGHSILASAVPEFRTVRAA
jgi:hypothetical protein